MGIISFKKLNCMCSPAIAAKTMGPHSVAREVSLFTRSRQTYFPEYSPSSAHCRRDRNFLLKVSFSACPLEVSIFVTMYMLPCARTAGDRWVYWCQTRLKEHLENEVSGAAIGRYRRARSCLFCAELGHQHLQPHMHNIQRRPTGREIS